MKNLTSSTVCGRTTSHSIPGFRPAGRAYVAPFFNEKSTSPTDGQRKSFAEANAVLKALGETSTPVLAGADIITATEQTRRIS
jgi:hypothetical protein